MPSILRPILLAVLGAALFAPAAQADPSQKSIMMDDDLLVYSSDATRDRAMETMRNLGADTVRVTLLWEIAAEDARFSSAQLRSLRGSARERAVRQNRRFRADNPRTYPTRNWDRYDNLVKKASEIGMEVYFNVTGPGPRWAHETAPPSQRRNQRTWKPRPGAYRDFVKAVGKRYSGTYRDENGGRVVIPRVSFWSLWNEPNQAGWLSPQWEFNRTTRSMLATSPSLYRRLHQFGREGLVQTGHGRDQILLGETAPLGMSLRSARAPMRPKVFLRELACVQRNGRAYSGRSARARGCGDLRRRGGLKATGFAHHPYTRTVAPTVRSGGDDALTMANISELGALLDDLSARTGGAIPRALPLWMTEFGYETNPPDVVSGISLERQSEFNNLGDLLAYFNPRIKGQSQFLLRDVGPVRKHKKDSKAYWFTYQSGLYFRSGAPKPAATAYALPFVPIPAGVNPETGGRKVSVWGQLRFRAQSRRPGSVEGAFIECLPQGSTAWQSAGEVITTTNPRGFFTGSAECPAGGPATFRAVFRNGQTQVFSRSAPIA
jgi:hypothetical protein